MIYMIIFCFIAFKLYQKYSCVMCTCDNKLLSKVAIVTGSNTGIGFETAQDLARRGAKVILACRDLTKANAAKERIIEFTGNKNIIVKHMDLTSLKSVRAFAEDVLKTETKLHILVNNAGTGKLDNSLTEDHLPIETQINYFGPFLLTTMLLPLLKSSAPSRIVNVSSIMHKFGTIDLDNIDKPAKNSIHHIRVYCNTKLANVLFTAKLSRDLVGTGVTANTLHPGAVSTDIFRNHYFLVRIFLKLVFITPWEGAQTTIHLATAPELANVSGKYFSNCVERRPSETAQDRELAEKLWKLSMKIVSDKKSV